MLSLKLKSGVIKNVFDLSQSEIQEQLKFLKLKSFRKKQDREKLELQLVDIKESIEQLMFQAYKIESAINKNKESVKSLNKLKTVLSKRVNQKEFQFEQVWEQFSNEQIVQD